MIALLMSLFDIVCMLAQFSCLVAQWIAADVSFASAW
jgi:hypothetical protein